MAVLGPLDQPAAAGDGVAAAIAGLLAGAGSAPPAVQARVFSTMPPLRGVERAVGDGVDMTNWNVVIDDVVIIKVTTRLGDGDRAVRLVSAVSRHAPDAVPTLYGALELHSPDDVAVVATATALVPGAVDGWTWAVDELEAHLDGGASTAWPAAVGAMLAGVHAALRRETEAVGCSADDAHLVSAFVRDAHELSTDDDPLARRLAARLDAMLHDVTALTAGSAPRFAIHGDLHLGQLLRDLDHRFTLIDFDGDPQAALGHDEADAAVDLAHLLVSIDLVGAIAAKRRQHDDPRIIDWCTQMQQQLLSAYRTELARRGSSELLDAARLPGLRAAQLVRELTYARDYLPRWSYAADWAISHRYSPRPDAEDPSWIPPALPTT
ncbi:MAG: hypothetical protein KIT89_03240 [Microcella sp.]|uniref:hypothetical protein n=1 Tax=Microcella sp. TaxID=1913979 RepID=UPI0024CA15A3|nr:hypothetical protein [Microcella sp.]UYN84234.1 MAG: hypothetical protein KIT89_03240 [Microcella sp.]